MSYFNGKTTRAPVANTISTYIVCIVLIFSQIITDAAQAQEQTLERQIKATFLYKFGNYIDWPEGTFAREDEPLIIGVIGADDIAEYLREIVQNKLINGRSVIVRTFESKDLIRAQILFIGRAEQSHISSVLSTMRGKPIVTVTEAKDGPSETGIINFVIDDNKVRFDIELDAANSGNIKISSRLLGVARKVISGTTS